MTRNLFHSLTILALAIFATRGRLLMGQSAIGDVGTRDSLNLRQARRWELAQVNFRATSPQTPESDRDPGAMVMAKTKGYEFTSIDYPGAYNSTVNDLNGKTALGCLNVIDSAFTFQGTSYVPLIIPGAAYSCAYGINTSGEIVGVYVDSSNQDYGFFYDGSRYTTIAYPGSVATYPYGINDAGLIVGHYTDSGNFEHGFLYDNGTFIAIDFPGAVATSAYGINSSGDLVGIYSSAGIENEGFLLKNGSYSTVDFPGADETIPFGINNAGSIAGSYTKSEGNYFATHGFTYTDGVFFQVDVPGATITSISRIDSKGNVVGTLWDSLGQTHGFIGR